MASIRKRAKADGGGYQVRYYGPDGRIRAKTFAARAEAVEFSNQTEADIGRGSWLDPKLAATPLSEYVSDYLKASLHWRPNTRIKVQGHLENYVLAAFGDFPIGDIRPTDVREWVVALNEHGLAPATVRGIYSSLSRVMNQAVIDGLIVRSPCIGISLPQNKVQRELVFLDARQVARLADAIPPRYRALIFTAAYTGMRWGELAALKVKNVDLLKGSIRVIEAATEVSGHLIEGPTKTGTARAISLPRFLCQMLVDHLAQYPSKGHLFTSLEGHPLRRNFYRRHFVPAVKTAGLPDGVRFHDLRHTCAALLIAQGAHPKEIQDRLGHSTIRVTFDRYGHLFPSLDERLRDGLDEVYRAARSARPNRAD
jgi:integrase